MLTKARHIQYKLNSIQYTIQQHTRTVASAADVTGSVAEIQIVSWDSVYRFFGSVIGIEWYLPKALLPEFIRNGTCQVLLTPYNKFSILKKLRNFYTFMLTFLSFSLFNSLTDFFGCD